MIPPLILPPLLMRKGIKEDLATFKWMPIPGSLPTLTHISTLNHKSSTIGFFFFEVTIASRDFSKKNMFITARAQRSLN